MKLRLAAIGLGAAVLCSATVATAAVLNTNSASPDGPLTGSAEQTRTYYATARASLSPLIVHVRDLPETLQSLAGGKPAPAGLRARALQWAEDCADARDLVGRVAAPSGTAGGQVVVLYQSAAMLYTEAARLAASAAAAGLPERQRADAVLGQHLYAIGDRLFDSAYRLLNSGGALTQSDLRFPGVVPDFASSATGAVAPQTNPTTDVPAGEWARRHNADLRALAGAMTTATTAATAVASTELTQAQIRIAEPVAGAAAQESVTGMRLAALILAEAGNRHGTVSGADVTTVRLELLASRLWTSSARLLPDGHLRKVATAAQVSTDDERPLFVGGHFQGHPPRLNPGEDPGAGLPGGLPALDAQALLGS